MSSQSETQATTPTEDQEIVEVLPSGSQPTLPNTNQDSEDGHGDANDLWPKSYTSHKIILGNPSSRDRAYAFLRLVRVNVLRNTTKDFKKTNRSKNSQVCKIFLKPRVSSKQGLQHRTTHLKIFRKNFGLNNLIKQCSVFKHLTLHS